MKMQLNFLLIISLLFSLSHTARSQQQNEIHSEIPILIGSTDIHNVYSPSLEDNLQGNPSTQPVKVYLPPAYDDYPKNQYPVVYLLHGYTGDYNSFYNWDDLFKIMNEMISEKIIAPMIIVTPNSQTIFDGSFYTNSYVSGNWEDFIVKEVSQFVESEYQILEQRESRGLSGFSMGGYGTVWIGMNNPSVYSSICTIGAAALDLEENAREVSGINKENLVSAARKNQYISSDSWDLRVCYALAVAFAPDSTSIPTMGRLPYSADGLRIDTIWQKWLEHDPITLLPEYKDSLLSLDAIQMYIGDIDDLLSSNESFHQALLDHGIDHGYEIYEGSHTTEPVLDDVLQFFSASLIHVNPNITSSSEYNLEDSDALLIETDMDATLYLVPSTTIQSLDSLYKYQVDTISIFANTVNEIQLSEYEYGTYRAYAITNDSTVSNLPEEFNLVPDKSTPVITLNIDTIPLGDSIKVSLDREGTICLVGPATRMDTMQTVSEIMDSKKMKYSAEAMAGEEISISTDGLSNTVYWIYGYDKYGIVAGPEGVKLDYIPNPTEIVEHNAMKIELYPNPAHENITLATNYQDHLDVVISNLNGQLIYSTKMEGTSHQIDLISFPKGVYFITIRSKDFVTTRKIIKK